jgi:hypothetical protein
MGLIERYGKMWARNKENIDAMPKSSQGGQGVYVLYDGPQPVYIGKGNLRQRVRSAHKSTRRGKFWDHFSWHVIAKAGHRHDVEALLLRVFPWYLRGLARQSAHFIDAKGEKQVDSRPETTIVRAKRKAPKR